VTIQAFISQEKGRKELLNRLEFINIMQHRNMQ